MNYYGWREIKGGVRTYNLYILVAIENKYGHLKPQVVKRYEIPEKAKFWMPIPLLNKQGFYE